MIDSLVGENVKRNYTPGFWEMPTVSRTADFSSRSVTDTMGLLKEINPGGTRMASHLKDRIRAARLFSGLTMEQMAERLGVSKSAVSLWETGRSDTRTAPKLDRLRAISKITSVTVDWLVSDDTELPEDWESQLSSRRSRSLLPSSYLQIRHSEQDYPLSNNVEEAPRMGGKVPVISTVQAGNYREVIDTLPPGHSDEWVETSCQVKSHTFALRVQGDSMEPDFPEGMILIVEPDMDPLPGDYVIAKVGDSATFKQLVQDGDVWYLRPLNKAYPTRPLGEGSIIGVVREVMRRLR